MADNASSVAEQFQAFASRWWSIASHPLQSLGDWWTPRFRPEASRQQMIIETEGPVTVLYRGQPRGHQTTAPGQTEPIPSQETPRASQTLSQRSLGYDSPEDVRLPRESGPASGSVEAARIDVRFAANRTREEEPPRSLLEQLDSLHARLDASQQAPQTRQQDQGRGW